MASRIELENMGIGELRRMAARAGLKTSLKSPIIAALADDYRNGTAGNGKTAAPVPEVAAPLPAPVDVGGINWPDVIPATSEINGDYVPPPWLDELKAAARIGHVELSGPAGSGKTLAVHHMAAALGKRLAVVTADGGLRKRDLVGQRELTSGSTVHQAAEFAAAARNGDWALIDEANMAEPDALSFLNGMTDRPGTTGSTFQIAGETIDVNPDFRCFLTRNPGYAGAKRQNEALRDRFWTIEVPPLLGASLLEMLEAHGVTGAIAKSSAYMVEILYGKWVDNRITYQVSPRRALAAAAMYGEMGRPGKASGYQELLTRSILTKIDAKHDRDAVEVIIRDAWDGYAYTTNTKARAK
jgi:hypothetical protein